MAGGIDWFRWHHGTVNDQKFPLVARKSGATVAEVIAVWACLLERASQAEDRGTVGAPDFEAMDCALGMEDGRSAAIFSALQSRDLIDDDARLTAWSARQPKKEDEGAADRKRAQREREAAAKSEAERDKQECHDKSRDVTLEKRREEKKSSSLRSEDSRAARSVTVLDLQADGLSQQTAEEWLTHRQRKKAKLTPRAWDGIKAEASKAGWSNEDAVRKALARGWTGFEAEWVTADKQPRAPPPNSQAADETQRYLAEQASHKRAAPPPEILARIGRAVKVTQ